MGFTKLDEDFFDSSLVAEGPIPTAVFVLLLAKVKPDGIARVAANVVGGRLGLTPEQTAHAFAVLEGTDPNSRSLEHDGRRIKRVDGGWLILNYQKRRSEGLREAYREYDKERKQKERTSGPDVSGQCPDSSASASVSASVVGSPFPGQRAEEATNAEIRRLQNELGAAIIRCVEHRNSRDMVPAWSRRITSWVRSDGTKVNGKADYRTITSIDRLQKSIDDAVWWLAELEKGPITEDPIGKR